ncbi:MAG: hypothetical protein V1820_02675 [archaeon]
MKVSGELVVAVLLGLLIIVSAVQTVQLVDLVSRAGTGSITLTPNGALAERKSSSPYSAPASSGAPLSGGGCG